MCVRARLVVSLGEHELAAWGEMLEMYVANLLFFPFAFLKASSFYKLQLQLLQVPRLKAKGSNK